MGFLNNLFGKSNITPISNVEKTKFQLLMKQIKKNSNWVEMFKISNSTLFIDQNSCYVDQDGSIFFLWRDVYIDKGDVYYFTVVNFDDDAPKDFYVLKQLTQVVKGGEDYSVRENKYTMGIDDSSVQDIIEQVLLITFENDYDELEMPEYINGLL